MVVAGSHSGGQGVALRLDADVRVEGTAGSGCGGDAEGSCEDCGEEVVVDDELVVVGDGGVVEEEGVGEVVEEYEVGGHGVGDHEVEEDHEEVVEGHGVERHEDGDEGVVVGGEGGVAGGEGGGGDEGGGACGVIHQDS